MKMKRTHIAAAAALLAAAPLVLAGSYQKTATGIDVRPDTGAARLVRLELMADNIVHVVKLDQADKALTPSLMTVAKPCACTFTVAQAGGAVGSVRLRAKGIAAEVSLKDGGVRFFDAAGTPFLTQATEAITPVQVGGKPFVAIREGFNHGTTDAYYGLGQHPNAQMNYNGEDVLLAQHNMIAAVPFVVSDKNYGLLWDNNAITRFGDPKPYAWLSRDLVLTGADGKPGGLTARYYIDGKLALTRQEQDVAYQYLKDVTENWPKELPPLKALGGKEVKVVWDGAMASARPGVHKMQLYASDYATLSVNGKQVMDVWRQGWNPWYHNFEVAFEKDKPVPLHLEWMPSGGMLALTHNDPLPALERHSLTMSSEIAEGIDYYVVKAGNMDDVIAGYRQLTGQAPMMPKWAYGFWQSRQRYETQQQLLDVVGEYRKRGWPLDNIVQDWFYWPEDGWGSHDFDKTRFPDPKGMVDAVHAQHARIMISIWGKFYANTDNYQELASKGHMWTKNVENGDLDWVGKGYKNSHYDPYTKEARDIYYRQLKNKLVDKGFDAWWMDNTEPDVLSNSRPEDFKNLIGPTVYGPGEVTFNPYSLVHSGGMAEHLRADQPDTRQFILSRSGFAGIQRNSTAVWSGDTASRWNNLHDQIAAGVNFSMSGVPNWTHDIGGYAQETRFQVGDVGSAQENRATFARKVNQEDLNEWRELNLRWFQFGAFSPLFRSHGEVVKREIYNIAAGYDPMRDSMVNYLKLRYRLMPYIYTLAADTHYASGTMMRGLVMDFPHDARVKSVNDQYLFGHALMVAPVVAYRARERKVVFPQGADWIDFDTGRRYAGGTTAVVPAPRERIPVFLRAGSIVATGPVMQYVDEKPDAPVTLQVVVGASGRASLYEDDGVTNAYQRGKFTRIPISYDDRKGVLTIGARDGAYDGMQARRVFKVRVLRPGVAAAADMDGADKTVAYDGRAVTIKL
jgi:alpha-D-xyloside xylohydrolase